MREIKVITERIAYTKVAWVSSIAWLVAAGIRIPAPSLQQQYLLYIHTHNLDGFTLLLCV